MPAPQNGATAQQLPQGQNAAVHDHADIPRRRRDAERVHHPIGRLHGHRGAARRVHAHVHRSGGDAGQAAGHLPGDGHQQLRPAGGGATRGGRRGDAALHRIAQQRHRRSCPPPRYVPRSRLPASPTRFRSEGGTMEAVNLSVLRGAISGPPEIRALESGRRIATLAVRTSAGDGRNTSVPVTVLGPAGMARDPRGRRRACSSSARAAPLLPHRDRWQRSADRRRSRIAGPGT